MLTFSKRISFLLIVFFLISCQNKKSEMQVFSGFALGTDYQLKFFSEEKLDLSPEIDSLFHRVNQSMSTYIETSDISRINKGDSTVKVDADFRKVFLESKDIYKKTDGYFDPTVGDLVSLYGLGPKKMNIKADSVAIDSLMRFVGLDKVEIDENNLIHREYLETVLDFNGIAKGYAVDLLGELLEKKGVTDYLTEIGGEIRTRGKNLDSGKPWRLGIDDPRIEENPAELSGVVELKNKSLATSGNYRKFTYDSITGEKYVHIINPKSGYTEKGNILSVSILAEECSVADAYATAFMAMDIKKAIEISKQIKELDVFFIYDEEGTTKTFLSKGFEEVLSDNKFD